MSTIGLRELTHHTAAVARRVRDGETVLVTDHGTPVLTMAPVTPAGSALSQLSAAGLLIPADHAERLPEPIETGAWSGEDSASVVSELRGDR